MAKSSKDENKNNNFCMANVKLKLAKVLDKTEFSNRESLKWTRTDTKK